MDSYWGADANIHSKSIKEGTTAGQNKFGLLLQRLRSELSGNNLETSKPAEN